METAPFDLKRAVEHWRQDLGASTTLGREHLDELEAHLLDSITAFEGRGLTPEESFFIATRRVGPGARLEVEFAKVQPGGVGHHQGAWMLAGVILYVVVIDLARIVSGWAVLAGNRWAIDGIGLGWLGIAVGSLMLGSVVLVLGWMAKRGSIRPEAAWGWWTRKPWALAGGLLGVLVVLKAAAFFVALSLASHLSPSRLGQVYAVIGWGNVAGPFLLVIVLSASLAWIVRAASRGLPAIGVLVIMSLVLWQGAGTKVNAQVSGESGNASGRREPATLDQAAALWTDGRRDESVLRFMAIDFTRPPLFPSGSVLGYSEQQFAALPSSTREKLSQEMLAKIRTLKELGAQVKARSQEASKAGQKAKAAEYLGQLKRCGEAFDQKDSLALLQLVGRAFKKSATL